MEGEGNTVVITYGILYQETKKYIKEHDLKEQFKLAFKRKYELNSVPFKKLDENVQALFSKAITVKANKPTFKVSTTVS